MHIIYFRLSLALPMCLYFECSNSFFFSWALEYGLLSCNLIGIFCCEFEEI